MNTTQKPVDDSPSLGMHAHGEHVEDADASSGDEDWVRSPEDDIHSPQAAAIAALNRGGADLPMAEEGDARAVDFAPGESPSPLPAGVWDNPGSGTSISLPQVGGGCASRDSTPRMFAGGANQMHSWLITMKLPVAH